MKVKDILKKWNVEGVKSTVVKWAKPATGTKLFHLFNSNGHSACGAFDVTEEGTESKRGFGEPRVDAHMEMYCMTCSHTEHWLTGGK